MTQERASMFGDEPQTDFDVSGFAPKKPEAKQKVTPVEAIRAVAATAKFTSREPAAPPAAAPSAHVTREVRRYRTGRNTQLNVKTTPETLDTFYKIADANGWMVGETFEKAVAALAQQLKKN